MSIINNYNLYILAISIFYLNQQEKGSKKVPFGEQ